MPDAVSHQHLLSPSPTSHLLGDLGSGKWEFRLWQSQLHKLSEKHWNRGQTVVAEPFIDFFRMWTT